MKLAQFFPSRPLEKSFIPKLSNNPFFNYKIFPVPVPDYNGS